VKKLLVALAILLGIAALAYALEVIASESGEVVVLQIPDDGGASRTRLWVVEMDGALWLRTQAGSRWLSRLRHQPDVRLERDGETSDMRGTVVETPAQAGAVNRRMREKYGLADRYVGWFLGDPGRKDAVTVRLEPR